MTRFLAALTLLALLAVAPLTAGCDHADPIGPVEDTQNDPDPDGNDPDETDGEDPDGEDPDESEGEDPDGDPPPDTVDAEALAAVFGCEVTVVAFDTVVNGTLEPEADCTLDDGRMVDYFAFLMRDDGPLAVEAISEEFDTVVILYDDQGTKLGENDDRGDGSTDSAFEMDATAGVYVAGVTAFDESQSGAYLFLTK